jgi:hypothetical protein
MISYLDLAIEAKALYLASRGNDTLALRDNTAPKAVEFGRRLPDIRIVDAI